MLVILVFALLNAGWMGLVGEIRRNARGTPEHVEQLAREAIVALNLLAAAGLGLILGKQWVVYYWRRRRGLPEPEPPTWRQRRAGAIGTTLAVCFMYPLKLLMKPGGGPVSLRDLPPDIGFRLAAAAGLSLVAHGLAYAFHLAGQPRRP